MGEARVDYSKLQDELETSVTFPKAIGIPIEIGKPISVEAADGGCRFGDMPLVESASEEATFTTSEYFSISFELGPLAVEVPASYCYGEGEVPVNGAIVILFQLPILTEPTAPPDGGTSDVPSNATIVALFQAQISPEPASFPDGGTSDVPSNGTVI